MFIALYTCVSDYVVIFTLLVYYNKIGVSVCNIKIFLRHFVCLFAPAYLWNCWTDFDGTFTGSKLGNFILKTSFASGLS